MIRAEFVALLLAGLPTLGFAQCDWFTGLEGPSFSVQPSQPQPECRQVKGLNGLQDVCFWSFDFRSDAAQDWFDSLTQDLVSCGFINQSGAQNRVNHPDTYDQHLYQMGQNQISIALKDKAALRRTYVFLTRG